MGVGPILLLITLLAEGERCKDETGDGGTDEIIDAGLEECIEAGRDGERA